MKANYEKVINDAFLNEIPISCTIEITSLCNWRCKHCYIPSYTEYGIPIDIIKKILLNLRQMGVHQIVFTGGECFKREDFMEIVKYARDLCFRVNILSNASLITEKIAKDLSELYITDFSLTIFSMNAKVHDRITQVKGSLEAALNGVNNLNKYKIPIEIKTPILKYNYEDFMEVKNYCDDMGFSFTTSPSIFTKSNGEETPLQYFIPENKLIHIIEEIDKAANFRFINNTDEYMCPTLRHSLFISSNGKVYPCNGYYLEVGDIYKNSIQDIWNSNYFRYVRNQKKSKNNECNDCKLENLCERCPGTVLSETGNIYDCSAMCKSVALARYNKYYERR